MPRDYAVLADIRTAPRTYVHLYISAAARLSVSKPADARAFCPAWTFPVKADRPLVVGAAGCPGIPESMDVA